MTTASELYAELTKKQEEISAMQGISALLHWDQNVGMPAGASGSRGKQLSALSGILHDKQTSPELGAVIDKLTEKAHVNDHTPPFTPMQLANIRDSKRNYDRESKIPRELAQRIAQLSAEGYETWVAAREKNDFSIFKPILAKWVDIAREKAKHIDPTKPAYEVLMDEYERGMTCARLNEIFSKVKAGLVLLIDMIKHKPVPDASALKGPFDTAEQAKFSHQIAKEIGFDTNKGRLDVSIHPFTTTISSTDIRMTTRYRSDDLVEGLTGTIHETGHALYEQGLDPQYSDQPAGKPLSMGIHESQSLFWERMIALSEPFWEHYWPILKERFPNLPQGFTASDFHRAINTVSAGLIRVEADEVTYPLHIILRYEIEEGLVSGKIPVDDHLAHLWNHKMTDYLGVTPTNDNNGILQDIHWSDGSFGYFPSYTLGAIYASQFYATAKEKIPNLEQQISEGKFSVLKEWLNENIHAKGSLLGSGDELCRSVTGQDLNPEYFMKYLSHKYTVLYKL